MFNCSILLKSLWVMSNEDEHLCKDITRFITSGPEVIKLFSCSTQLSMKFQMLISIKISRISAFLRLS